MAVPELPECDSPAAVLAFAQRRRAVAQRAEVDVVEAALVWAAMHPEESVAEVSPSSIGGLVFGEVAVPLAGEGAPLVAEFAPMELGAALGMSTDSARSLVGDALELAHRLKRTWKLVRAGRVPLWKARRLAQLATTLPLEGAEFVDRQLAGFVGKTSWAGIERLVDQARVTFDPEGAEKERREAADARHFDVHTREASHDGTVHVEETRSVVSTEQVRDWCANPQTQVTIKPAIDLEAHHHTDACAIPDRPVEQTRLAQPVCAFPWCDRPARRCDTDHVTAHGDGGPTCSCNLAPLCRRHHRAKTHTAWTYAKTDAATYVWRSPHGLHLIKDHATTCLVTAHPPDE